MDDFEIKRKAAHLGGGFALIAGIYFNVLNSLTLLTIIALSLLFFYLIKRMNIKPLLSFAKHFERKRQFDILPGISVLYFLLGCWLAVTLFEKDIAISGILILTLGDSLSPLFGINYGKIKNPFNDKKYIEGSVIGLLAAFTGVMLFSFWGYINIKGIEAFIASLVAMLIEGIELKLHMDLRDDNLIIPVIAGGVIWLIRLFY